MERVVRKIKLAESGREADREAARLSYGERMLLLEELLRRGEAFYKKDETTEGDPPIYRVINLRES